MCRCCLDCVGGITLLRVLVFLGNCMVCWFWVACFSPAAKGVAWDLIDTVDDVNGMDDYNWSTVVWEFFVDAMEETKEKMRIIKNLQKLGLQWYYKYDIKSCMYVSYSALIWAMLNKLQKLGTLLPSNIVYCLPQHILHRW